jgi:enoyl-CoA hydratase
MTAAAWLFAEQTQNRTKMASPMRFCVCSRGELTGDCITGAQAAEWGLAIEAPEPADLDDRTERLERIAAVPVNQLIMVKLAMNTALYQQGVAASRMVSTVFGGIARHTPEGYAFVADARAQGFREAVRHRDEPFADYGRRASGV